MTEEQPKGRTMRDLRAIVAAEDKRRQRLLNAWVDLPEHDQNRVIALAQELRASYE